MYQCSASPGLPQNQKRAQLAEERSRGTVGPSATGRGRVADVAGRAVRGDGASRAGRACSSRVVRRATGVGPTSSCRPIRRAFARPRHGQRPRSGKRFPVPSPAAGVLGSPVPPPGRCRGDSTRSARPGARYDRVRSCWVRGPGRPRRTTSGPCSTPPRRTRGRCSRSWPATGHHMPQRAGDVCRRPQVQREAGRRRRKRPVSSRSRRHIRHVPESSKGCRASAAAAARGRGPQRPTRNFDALVRRELPVDRLSRGRPAPSDVLLLGF